MKKVILAISGRKQSGKSSTFEFIEDQWNDEYTAVWEFSFADPLKKMCIDLLGLKPEQVYGTDDQKNSPVPHLLWENFPIAECRRIYKPGGVYVERLKTGPMTGREVMQYWGTEVFRAAYPDVWAKAAIKLIDDWADEDRNNRELNPHAPKTLIAVLPDCRFPNEVRAAQEAGGHVLRLTRCPFPEDTHFSEIALDRDAFDWAGFDHVGHNLEQGVEEQMEGLSPWLREIGAIP